MLRRLVFWFLYTIPRSFQPSAKCQLLEVSDKEDDATLREPLFIDIIELLQFDVFFFIAGYVLIIKEPFW